MKNLRQDSVSSWFPFCAITEGNKMILWKVGIVWQTEILDESTFLVAKISLL